MNFKKLLGWIENNINNFVEIMYIMTGLLGLAATLILLLFDTFKVKSNMSQELLFGMIVFLLTVQILYSSKYTSSLTNIFSSDPRGQTIDTRLYELTSSLTQAGSAISAIEEEIDSRQELVGKLEKQKLIAEEAIKLSKEQVDAVSALLSEQVAKQSRKDSRVDWIKQILFFILGVLATIFLTKFGLG